MLSTPSMYAPVSEFRLYYTGEDVTGNRADSEKGGRDIFPKDLIPNGLKSQSLYTRAEKGSLRHKS